MPSRSSHLAVAVFAAATVLVAVNALALFGSDVAGWIALALQSLVGFWAVLCAVATSWRAKGFLRWWRVLVLAAMCSWFVGEVLWWLGSPPGSNAEAPPASVAAYFLPPVFSLAAMVLLARYGGGQRLRQRERRRSFRGVDVLDGLVAAAAFTILVAMAGLGAVSGAALPRSQNTAIVIAYSLVELIVIVLAVLMAMTYPRNRPYRANYLLLSGGVVLIVASDRMVAYLRNVGVDNGDLWGGVGTILGPLLISFALLERRSHPAGSRGDNVMDSVQTIVPYLGFLGIIGLLAFHLLIGRDLSAPVILGAMAMVTLVTARQGAAMRAQRQLTQRLYEAQHRLAHQVHHDVLTGLPNRLLFAQRLDDAMKDGRFVLIFVDIDDFKEVNDQYGHAAGDELLCAVGGRLRNCVGATDTLARIGGDEFAILIEGEYEAPEVVADRLRLALRDPFAIHGSSVRVRVSMGLVRPRTDDPASTSDDLLRQADISMYAGKRLGKDTAVVYRPSASVSAHFPSVLRSANGAVPPGFSLTYQTVVALPHEAPVAVEALARWIAPNGMQIPPESFVAGAEGAGLGAALDAMVLDLACREMHEAGLRLDIHVNVGAARLGNPEFEEQVVRTLHRHGIGAQRLVLEITETVPIVDLSEGAAAIRRLSALGIRVALDDFGAGFNSLTYLHALPVDVVKLDRSLLVGADTDRGLALYRSMVDVCGALGLDVIAEGIESAAQADIVHTAGGRMAQGYLFGRPVGMSEMKAALSSHRQKAAPGA